MKTTRTVTHYVEKDVSAEDFYTTIRKPKRPATAKVFAAFLKMLTAAVGSEQMGIFVPISANTICKDTGVNRPSVTEGLRVLVDDGFLVKSDDTDYIGRFSYKLVSYTTVAPVPEEVEVEVEENVVAARGKEPIIYDPNAEIDDTEANTPLDDVGPEETEELAYEDGDWEL